MLSKFSICHIRLRAVRQLYPALLLGKAFPVLKWCWDLWAVLPFCSSWFGLFSLIQPSVFLDSAVGFPRFSMFSLIHPLVFFFSTVGFPWFGSLVGLVWLGWFGWVGVLVYCLVFLDSVGFLDSTVGFSRFNRLFSLIWLFFPDSTVAFPWFGKFSLIQLLFFLDSTVAFPWFNRCFSLIR